MVEFNLLPDVKMKFLRAKRLEHLVITISFIVAAASLIIFILLFLFVDVAQKVRINNLSSQISSSEHQLNSNAGNNLNKILTIQKQIESLPALEAASPQVSRLFNYLSELTPNTATISTLTLDFTNDSLSLQGSADSLNTVNQFVDTLKFATYKVGNSSTSATAFNSVDLSSFGYDNIGGQATSSSYTISFDFNPAIFNPADQVTLVVPSETTTRSVLDSPNILFKSNSTGQ